MVFENKLGITNSADLAREEKISKRKAIELFESGLLDTLEAGKFSTLKAIHKCLYLKRKFSLCSAYVFRGGFTKY